MSNQEKDAINNILESVKATLKEANMMGFDSYAEQTIAFFKAVDWTQPWIITILAFHVLCFVAAIALRNHHTTLSIYFFILLGFAALTQPLNSLGMKHWRSFSPEPYFDASGAFIVSIYAFPLILNGFITLMFILKATMTTLIDTKRAQLKQKMRNSAKKSKQN